MNKLAIFQGVIIGFTIIATIFIILLPSHTSESQPCEPAQSSPKMVTTAPLVVENFVESVNNFVENETISTVPPCTEETAYTASPSYTTEQLEILAIIIYQEAGGDACSDDTRLKVGNVFLNRVTSSYFPDTFVEVATAKRQYGSLYWTGIKWPSRADNAVERHAVQRAYDIAKRLLEGERVLPENVIWQAEFEQGDGVYCYQDGIYFCYSEEDK